MKVYNYFNLRWVEGYSFVSDAPNSVNILVEEISRKVIASNERPIIQIVFDKTSSMQVALLKTNIFNSRIRRNVNFLHAFAFKNEESVYRKNDLVSSFLHVYGPDVKSSIESLYLKLSSMEKSAQGRQILERYYVNEVVSESIIIPIGIDVENIPADEEVETAKISDEHLPEITKNSSLKAHFQRSELSQRNAYLSLRSIFFSLQKHLVLVLLFVVLIQFLVIVWRAHTQETTLGQLYQSCLSGKITTAEQKIQYVDSKDYVINFFCKDKQLRLKIFDIQKNIVNEFNVKLSNKDNVSFYWEES
jgi:hypothetical protein